MLGSLGSILEAKRHPEEFESKRSDDGRFVHEVLTGM